jgi:CHAT domain-containing protein
LRLIAAHASSGSHRVDQAYLDKGLSKLSIRRICKHRTPNNLTILAVCEGGVGQTISTGSSFSIASAYLFSGASSCVYSNSVLDDKVGAEILADFLERLKNGEMKDWALRNAKLTYLQNVTSEEGYNPIYWAGLQVMGDVSPVEIGKSYVIWYYIVGLTLLVGLIFIIKRRLRLDSV